MNYQETLSYLYNRLPVFHHVGAGAYKPGLDNSISLMEMLGNPHMKFRTIHVAGTNGKGSVSHFLAAILQSAGYKVGLYTSPHLVDFRERIRVNGIMIDQQYVVDFVSNHFNLFDKIEPSFFETTMALSFSYFESQSIDVAVIEVGLGGRLDSTNIISPDLSVITNIGFDHVGFLGDTLAKIAYEKAGIIKPNVPVVIGETVPETKSVFAAKAKQVNAEIVFAHEIYKCSIASCTNEKLSVLVNNAHKFHSGLIGKYQLKNIATVLCASDELLKLGYSIPTLAIEQGLSEVVSLTGLRGRWEQLNSSPLVICDTGHNLDGLKYVVGELSEQTSNVLRIVIGMVSDKDIISALKILPKHAVYYFTQANIQRAMSANDLMNLAQNEDLNGKCYPKISDALVAVMNDATVDDLVFIGGSNFVVGEAISFFDSSKN